MQDFFKKLFPPKKKPQPPFPPLGEDEVYRISQLMKAHHPQNLVYLSLEKVNVAPLVPGLYNPQEQHIRDFQDGLIPKILEKDGTGKILRWERKSLVAAYTNAISAFEAACKILKEVNIPFGYPHTPPFRLALSYGATVLGAEEKTQTPELLVNSWISLGVLQAARMASLASAGTLLISQEIRHLLLPWLGDKPEILLIHQGPHRLEGYPEVTEIYQVSRKGEPTPPPLGYKSRVSRLPSWFFLLTAAVLGFLLSTGVQKVQEYLNNPVVYFYDFISENLSLNDSQELFIEDTGVHGKKRLNNPIRPGRHTLSVNRGGRSSRYYYLFEVQPGENHFRPDFKEYRLPEYQRTFEYTRSRKEFDHTESFEYKIFNEALEEVSQKVEIKVELQAAPLGAQSAFPGEVRFTGKVFFTAPNGEVKEIPVDSEELPPAFTSFWADRSTEYQISLNQYGSRLVVLVRGVFHKL